MYYIVHAKSLGKKVVLNFLLQLKFKFLITAFHIQVTLCVVTYSAQNDSSKICIEHFNTYARTWTPSVWISAAFVLFMICSIVYIKTLHNERKILQLFVELKKKLVSFSINSKHKLHQYTITVHKKWICLFGCLFWTMKYEIIPHFVDQWIIHAKCHTVWTLCTGWIKSNQIKC